MLVYILSFILAIYTFILGFNEIVTVGITIKAFLLVMATPILSFVSTSLYLIKKARSLDEKRR